MTRPAGRGLFDEKFYKDIVHEMDPEQEITPEAIDYLNKVALVFFEDMFGTLFNLKRGGKSNREGNRREDVVVTANDVYFVLQTKYRMSLPSATAPVVTDQTFQNPTAEYQEKLQAVRKFAESHADD